MYTISKTWTFDAAHKLDRLPSSHKCAQLHGHTYRVELILESKELDSVGFVLDYGDLDSFGAWLQTTFDHTYLNDVMWNHPTTEHIAEYCYTHAKKLWPNVASVKVYESSTTWAEYRS
jgi:6-pyruvoyltetrahydropterin/6-carboxytetrahydropterin synthase